MDTIDITPLDRLSSAVPKSITKKRYSAFDIAGALSEFMYEEFKGLGEVTSRIKGTGCINISAEHLAYLLKLILKYVDGRFFLNITVTLDSGSFVIDISFDGNLELEFSEKTSIIAAAKGAGFEFLISDNRMSFRAKEYSKSPAMFVYAGDMQLFKRTLYKIFFNLF